MSPGKGLHMRAEIAEIPAAVQRLQAQSGPLLAEIAARLRSADPALLVTVARGSSDHAATLLNHACATCLGLPAASLGPSLASIYEAPLRLGRAATIAISQSGRSPDLLALLAQARAGGAMSLAIVNDPASPLALAAQQVVPLQAGIERSVAATKTFVASAAAGLGLIAAWAEDAPLAAALERLPERLAAALQVDGRAPLELLTSAPSLYVLGRGPMLAIAQEAALKCKEVALLHAEALSAAEVLHGPAALVQDGFPVLAFVSDDQSLGPVLEVVERLRAQGGHVMTIGAGADRPGPHLPLPAGDHPCTDALVAITAFYGTALALALARGHDPDRPVHLAKVTQTR